MRTREHLALAALASFTLLGAAGAQTTIPQTTVPLAALEALSPITAGPTAPDGRWSGLWGGGPDYKVSFHDGMTFYPCVGPNLPHQPLRWRTTSIRAGGKELLRGDTTPAPRHGATRCEYDLGVAVERYDLLPAGLEQSFVLPQRPPAGDLVITGEIATPLVVEQIAEAHAGITLSLPDGRAVIDYGAATAIDAAGNRTALKTSCDGHTIRLRVPAAVIAAATFPLVVDPIIATTILEAGNHVLDIDVLHETLTPASSAAGNWVVYSREAAAGDSDIWIKRFADDFTGAAIDTFQEISGWDSRQGQLALAPAAGKVVMAFASDSGSSRFVVLHRHDVTDLVLTTSVVTPFVAAGTSDWRPDIGGHLPPNGDKVLVVFQREATSPHQPTATSTVLAAVYDADAPAASAVTVPPTVLRARANADQERPVCNQSANANDWLIAFQEHDGSVANDDWDILTLAFDSFGNVSPGEVATAHAGNPQRHKISPHIAGSHGRYLLSYVTRQFELPNPKPGGTSGDKLYAQRIDWDHGTNTGSRPHPVVELETLATDDLRAEAVAFDHRSKSHWVVARSDAAARTYRIRKLGYTGNQIETVLFTTTQVATLPGFAVAFNETAREFPLAFGSNVTTTVGRVVGTVLRYVTVAPPTLVDFACGSGVWSGLNATADRQQLGSEAMPLRLAGAPLDSVAVLMIAVAENRMPGFQFGAPGCTLVPDVFGPGYLGSIATAISGGAASATLDLPEWLSPFTLSMQWGYLVPGANALGALASEGLRVDVSF